MITRTFRILVRFVLVLAVLCWALSQASTITASAQATKPAPEATKATATATPTASSNTQAPKLAPPPGKMQGWTTEMRRQAAIRNAERKAQAQRAAAANSQPQEVKQ